MIEPMIEAMSEHEDLRLRAECAEAERDRLRAIVERLPQTVDGVPVVPGMTIYVRSFAVPQIVFDRIVCRIVIEDGITWIGTDPQFTVRTYYLHEVYSTREAAEAARNTDRERMTEG